MKVEAQTNVEYRVRQVNRFIVTRYSSGWNTEGEKYGYSEVMGEFENSKMANDVIVALAERERLVPRDFVPNQKLNEENYTIKFSYHFDDPYKESMIIHV